jgi:hydroxypyruvate isomerase
MTAPEVSANLGLLYTDLPLVEAIAAAAADGFDAVELHWPYDTDPTDLNAALASAGLPCLSLNTARGGEEDFGLSAVPGREAEAQAAIERAVDYASAAGIGMVHVMAGRAEGAEAERAFLRALDFAVLLAESAGLRLLIEPLNTRDVPGYFLTSTDEAARIVDRIGSPRLGIMYDFYHMQVMQGDHMARLATLGGRVFHHQIAAVPDRGEPDEGELNLPRILAGAGIARVGAEYRPSMAPRAWLARFRAAF